jgi:hypothetical protein
MPIMSEFAEQAMLYSPLGDLIPRLRSTPALSVIASAAKQSIFPLVGRVVQNEVLYTVIPAKAGIQGRSMCGQVWMPAFAGMTLVSPRRTAPHF